MILEPSSVGELQTALAELSAKGGKVTGVNLAALHRVLEHTPEDMTVTVETGIRLHALQSQLAGRGQWLPIDPPNPEAFDLRALLDLNLSGPRRFGYGTIRDYLLGLKVVLADGRVIKAGGKVVKNVAGYDLCKLFIGSRGSLGIAVEATFKLQPLPEAEQFVQARAESLEKVGDLIAAVLESQLAPVVLDLHNLSTLNPQPSTCFSLVLGLAGTRDEVEWQLAQAQALGLGTPSSLEYEHQFWIDGALRMSVLPSRLIETLRGLAQVPFVARAGNGVIHYRGAAERAKAELPFKLMERVKHEFDPNHVLPELPL